LGRGQHHPLSLLWPNPGPLSFSLFWPEGHQPTSLSRAQKTLAARLVKRHDGTEPRSTRHHASSAARRLDSLPL
jgi:hypothetical protein